MNPWLLTAALNGFLAVAAGAFAAHFLAQRLGPDHLAWFETAVRYQAYHALALLAIGCLSTIPSWRPRLALQLAGLGFVAGILLFSGSLYVMALTGLRGLGLVTPLGGLCLLLGWGALVALAFRAR